MSEIDDIRAQADRLLNQAGTALERHSKEFENDLESRIKDLRRAIKNKDYLRAKKISYGLKAASGSFDWPMISVSAGFLRYVLDEQDKITKPDEVIEVHMNTIELLYASKLKGRTPEGIALIQELNAVLDKYDIKPGV